MPPFCFIFHTLCLEVMAWEQVKRYSDRTFRRLGSCSRAVARILRKYFGVALGARRQDLLAIFRGLDLPSLGTGLESLTRSGVVWTDVKVLGAEGKWYFLNCGMMSPV